MRDLHWDPWVARRDVLEFDEDEGNDYGKSHTERETQVYMAQQIHDISMSRLYEVWGKRCEIMREKLVAAFLQIDLEEAHCALGCCRAVEYICRELGPFDNGFPNGFEVIGLKDEAEAIKVTDRISKLNNISPCNIVCKDAQGQPYLRRYSAACQRNCESVLLFPN